MTIRNRAGLAAVGLAASLALVAPALAGTLFRLDIGHPIASAGTGKMKKAVLLVRGLACDDPGAVRMTGSAEGIANGARRSIPLELVPLPAAGVFAVPAQWPTGQWVLNLTGTCPGRNETASAVVPLGGPTGFLRERSQFYQSAATPEQVSASLNALVQGGTK